jgi:hypothetical protein
MFHNLIAAIDFGHNTSAHRQLYAKNHEITKVLMNAFQLDEPICFPRLEKQSHSTDKHPVQHNSDAEGE